MRQNTLKRSLLLCLLGTFTTNFSFSQAPFDHSFQAANGSDPLNARGKSILVEDCDAIVTVNSIRNENGFYDFQINTIKSSTGSVHSSFTYGNPNGHDLCHGVCENVLNEDSYILCGKSANGNMLVMEVKNTGGIVWSKEIIFANKSSEAISVLPMYPEASGEIGYMIVGRTYIGPISEFNSAAYSEIAAVRLDANGNVKFANEYPMSATYKSNVVTDAAILDGGNAAPIGNKICSITGHHLTASGKSKVFVIEIETHGLGTPVSFFNHAIYEGTQSGFFHRMIPQIVSYPIPPNSTPYNYPLMIAFSTPGTSHFSQVNKHLTVFKANAGSPGISWAHSFTAPYNAGLAVKDMIQLGNGDFSILGYEHPESGFYNPFTLNIDQNGGYLSQTSHNRTNRVKYPNSIVTS